MRAKRLDSIWKVFSRTAAGLTLLVFLSLAVACKPGQFLQRNACELLNCDVLFFVDDMFPLATPSGGGGGGGGGSEGMVMDEEEEEDDAHMH